MSAMAKSISKPVLYRLVTQTSPFREMNISMEAKKCNFNRNLLELSEIIFMWGTLPINKINLHSD